MNYRQLEAFRTVMIAGSTVRAAELMRVTQPAVSRNIAELEATLGFLLFDRVHGRLVPTPEGQLFFREVDVSFRGLDHLRSAAAGIRDYGSGALRVASLAAMGASLVPEAIAGFLGRNDKIRVTLQVASSSAVRNLVAEGGFDIGLAADEVDLSGIDSQHFGGFPAVFVMPKGHPLAALDTIRPEDLRGECLIGLAPEDRARHRIDAVLSDHGVTPNYVVETPGSATICALALAGAGAGFVNPLTVQGYVERGLVIRPFLPATEFRSYLLFRPDAQKSTLVRGFIAALFEARSTAAGSVVASNGQERP